jgi:pimeloyl-ACP methyl ester carboxylesterase
LIENKGVLMLSGNLISLLQENSTNVQTEISLKSFKLRAAALRVPFFNRADRLADLFCTPLPGTRARASGADIAPLKKHVISIEIASSQSTRDWMGEPADYGVYTHGNPSQQPYVLCAHGWSSFGARFAPWAKSLAAAGFAMVSFDSQAHGSSDGKLATFPSFIDSINAMRSYFGEPAAVIGHSFGAAALAVAAADHGLRCPMVLIAPPADLMVAIHQFVKRVGLSPAFAQTLADQLSSRIGKDARDYRAAKFASRIRNPLLVIHDQEDREVAWAAGAQYASLIENARIFTTTGLGHHRILNDASTLSFAVRHILGDRVGEKLLVSGADLQSF